MTTVDERAVARSRERAGWAIAGFTLAASGIVPFLGLPTAALGAIVSAIGWRRARGVTGRRLAVAGFVIAVVATAFHVGLYELFVHAMKDIRPD